MISSRIFPLSIITSTRTGDLHVSILISIQFRVRILCRLVYRQMKTIGALRVPELPERHVSEGKAIAERDRLLERCSTYVWSSVAQPSEVKCRLMGWNPRRKRRTTSGMNTGGSGSRLNPGCLYGIIQSGLMKKGDRSHSGRRWKMIRASGKMSLVSRYLIDKVYAMYDTRHGTVPWLITQHQTREPDSSKKKAG